MPCGAAAASTPQQHLETTSSCKVAVRKAADSKVVKKVPAWFSQTSVRFWSKASFCNLRASALDAPGGTPSPAKWKVQRFPPKTTALPTCASDAMKAPPQGEKPGVNAVGACRRLSQDRGNTRVSWPKCGSPTLRNTSSSVSKARGAICRRVMDHAVRNGLRSSSTSCCKCT